MTTAAVTSGGGSSDGQGGLSVQVVAGEAAPNRISGRTFAIVGGVQAPSESGTTTPPDFLFSSGFER